MNLKTLKTSRESFYFSDDSIVHEIEMETFFASESRYGVKSKRRRCLSDKHECSALLSRHRDSLYKQISIYLTYGLNSHYI